MSHPPRGSTRRPRTAGLLLGMAVGALQGCGGDGTAAPTPASAGAFTLATAKATLPILQGGGGEAAITIARAGFTESVALAVAGAPAGVTATVTPSTAGTRAMLEVTTTAAAATGRVTLTITGSALGRAAQVVVTLDITRSPGGAGNVTVDFSACAPADRPVWFAFQDGAGAWTQILGEADVYRFDVASGTGGYAYARPASHPAFSVALAARAELTRGTIRPCVPAPTATKTVSGAIVGLDGGDVAYVGLGGPNPDPEQGPTNPQFTLPGIRAGAQDLIAYRSNPVGLRASERAIIRRDQDVPDRGVVAPIDFAHAESFAPATARATVTGAGADPFVHEMAYLAGAECSYYGLYYQERSHAADFTVRGIPAARQRPTDRHRLVVFASGPDSWRSVSETFHTLGDRIVALPTALPSPQISALPGEHRRTQATLTLPPEYQQVQLLVRANDWRGYAAVTASSGWLGGTAATLAFPDFAGVTGWRSDFLPPSNSTQAGWWSLTATGANDAAAGGACADGARTVHASAYGWK